MFNFKEIEGMKAEEIINNVKKYYNISNIDTQLPNFLIYRLCDIIRKAPGDRAHTIYNAQVEGWWDRPDRSACIEILKAPGCDIELVNKMKKTRLVDT